MRDINNIVSTTTQTIEKLKEYSNGGNALFLYFDYIKHSRMQNTNQVWCNDKFMMKSIGFGVDKFRNAKKLLKELGLIEVIQKRGEDGKLGKYYIKINFLIGEGKREKSIKPESGKTQKQVKPESGETETNALSNKIKMLEEENKMLKKSKQSFVSDTESDFEASEFLRKWNVLFGKNYMLTEDYKKSYKNIRKKYTVEQIEIGTSNYYRDKIQKRTREERKKFELHILKFITQKNGLPNYL